MGITTVELIKLLGKSKPTIYKLVKIYKWQQFSFNMHQGGKRLIYEIPIEDLKEIALKYDVPEQKITEFYIKKRTDGNLKNTEKTKTDGNQTKSMVTDSNPTDQTDGNQKTELKNESQSQKNLLESRYAQNKLRSLLNEIPALSDRNPSIELNEKDLEIAKLRAQLCKKIDFLLQKTCSKRDIWRSITDSYNEGFLIPELLSLNGIKCERTLRRWFTKYQENDRDFYELAPKYKACLYRGRDTTSEEQGFLLKLLLTPNRIKPGTAIRKLKQFKRLDIVQSSSSKSTLYRWVNDWKNSHLEQWILAREGMKAFQEKINKTIFRDSSVLSVGDVWVADGHVLNFDILDPVTGKPKRMMMIMFLDWASRYPVLIIRMD